MESTRNSVKKKGNINVQHYHHFSFLRSKMV